MSIAVLQNQCMRMKPPCGTFDQSGLPYRNALLTILPQTFIKILHDSFPNENGGTIVARSAHFAHFIKINREFHYQDAMIGQIRLVETVQVLRKVFSIDRFLVCEKSVQSGLFTPLQIVNFQGMG